MHTPDPGQPDLLVCQDVSLKKFTTFKVGGDARWFAEPKTPKELADVLRWAHDKEIRVLVLGGGSNVIIRDGRIDALVVRLRHLKDISIEGVAVEAGAGAGLGRLVRQTVRTGLQGLEGLVGIPGTVGGAVLMNAGGHHAQIGEAVTWVEGYTPDGTHERRMKQDIRIQYRKTDLHDLILTRVGLQLVKGDPDHIEERRAFAKKVWDKKYETQPMHSRNAGCIFKNPPGTYAGKLIDEAGLKGHRVGDAQVSEVHANFLLNLGGARSEDLLALVHHVRSVIRNRHNIELEMEVKVWP